MSARDHAFCAGDKSSVLVSPSTLNTVNLISLGNSFLLVNQSALAHDSSNAVANLFPELCFSATSWNASKTKVIFDNALTASSANSLSNNGTKACTLYPPSMVPNT